METIVEINELLFEVDEELKFAVFPLSFPLLA